MSDQVIPASRLNWNARDLSDAEIARVIRSIELANVGVGSEELQRQFAVVVAWITKAKADVHMLNWIFEGSLVVRVRADGEVMLSR